MVRGPKQIWIMVLNRIQQGDPEGCRKGVMISEAFQAFRASQKGSEGATYPEVGKLTTLNAKKERPRRRGDKEEEEEERTREQQ